MRYFPDVNARAILLWIQYITYGANAGSKALHGAVGKLVTVFLSLSERQSSHVPQSMTSLNGDSAERLPEIEDIG